MPLALTMHAESRPRLRLRTHETPEQILHRLADSLVPELHTVWTSVFRDVRAQIPVAALREALASGNPVLVEDVLAPVWQRIGSAQAQTVLPVLAQEAVRETATALVSTVGALRGVEIGVHFNVIVPETLALIDTYVGTQIQSISETTLLNVRQVIRQGFAEGRTLTQQMEALEQFIGLTPRQTAAIARLRAQWEAEGITPSRVSTRVREAAQRAQRLRVEMIARTESMALTHLGQQVLLEQAVQNGFLEANRIRRFWTTSADERLCPRCAPVPSMNPEGVRLHEPFNAPGGSVLSPPLHVACRCTASISIL